MKVDRTGVQSRAERHAFKQTVEVRTDGAQVIETESQDLSLSGMALSFSAPVMDNGQFVELHAEGLGVVTGTVARVYDGGAAVQFDRLLGELPMDAQSRQDVDEKA